MIIEDELLAVEQRANAATPGPWETREDSDYYQGGIYIGVEPYHYPGPKPGRPEKFPENCYFETDVCRVESGEADRDFILHARTDIPALVNEVRRLQHHVQAIQTLVAAQAEDDGLWFVPDSVVEAYFQQELRRLHAVIEDE